MVHGRWESCGFRRSAGTAKGANQRQPGTGAARAYCLAVEPALAGRGVYASTAAYRRAWIDSNPTGISGGRVAAFSRVPSGGRGVDGISVLDVLLCDAEVKEK